MTDASNDFFGTPRAANDFGFKFHSISDKEPSTFRIAPPVKSLRTSGRWHLYDPLHQGYTIPNPENPDKPRWKPFRCIFKRDRNKMVTQDCPECTRMEDVKKRLDDGVKAYVEKLVSTGIAQPEAERQAKEAFANAAAIADKFYLDRKYYVLAKNLAGEWGVLKLPSSMIWNKGQKGTLIQLMDKFSTENAGASALDPNVGVWFTFTRSGQKFGTQYTVQVATEAVGGGAFRYKPAPLTGVDIQGLEKCPDLATLHDEMALTYDQILALVRSGGDPSVVATVFGQPTRRTPPPATPAPAAAAPAPMPPIFTVPVTPVVAPAAVTPVEDEVMALRRKLAEMEAKAAKPAPAPAATAPVVPAVPPAVVTPAVATTTAPTPNFAEMMGLDPVAFLKMFPDPNK